MATVSDANAARGVESYTATEQAPQDVSIANTRMKS
jgi:hypothetical protein